MFEKVSSVFFIGEVSKSVVYEVPVVFRELAGGIYGLLFSLGDEYCCWGDSKWRSQGSTGFFFIESVAVLKVGVVEGEAQ